MVSVPHLECVGGEADVTDFRFALLLHLGMVQDVGVQGPRPLHGTVFLPTSTVAVAVSGQLALEGLVLAEHLVVVGGTDLTITYNYTITQFDNQLQ